MEKIKFLAYQKGTIPARTIPERYATKDTKKHKKGDKIPAKYVPAKDVEIAVELETVVADVTQPSKVLGSVFKELFDFMLTCKYTGAKVLTSQLPIMIRYNVGGEVVDTGSFMTYFQNRMKLINNDKGRKNYAKRVWSTTIYHTTERKPQEYLPATGELKPVALLEAPKPEDTRGGKKGKKAELQTA
jgi:hypothetical protein